MMIPPLKTIARHLRLRADALEALADFGYDSEIFEKVQIEVRDATVYVSKTGGARQEKTTSEIAEQLKQEIAEHLQKKGFPVVACTFI